MMKNEILKFLKQDYLNNLDLIYALEHGAKIKYYNQAGIMLKFEDIYMLAFKDEKIAEQLLKQIDKCSMLAIHNDKYFNIINQKWRLNKEIVAYQYGYLKKYVRIINNQSLKLKKLGGNILNLLKKIILLRLKKHICLNELMLMYLWVRLLKSRLLDLLGVI